MHGEPFAAQARPAEGGPGESGGGAGPRGCREPRGGDREDEDGREDDRLRAEAGRPRVGMGPRLDPPGPRAEERHRVPATRVTERPVGGPPEGEAHRDRVESCPAPA